MIRRILDTVAIVLFVAMWPALAMAQVTKITPAGGGGVVSGNAASGCTINSLVYIDASGNLACAGAAKGSGTTTLDNGAAAVSPLVVNNNGTPVFTIANGGSTTLLAPLAVTAATAITATSTTAGGGGQVLTRNDRAAATSQATVVQFGTAIAATVFGVVNPTDWTGFYAEGANNNGMFTGTRVAKPVLIGVNDVPRIVVCQPKTLSNTSATTTTLATVGLASNTAAGASVTITVTATDGTNFDSETQSVTLSYVNKAGTFTVSTPTITASSAANNSGSATIGFTATGASSLISLKVTPVFTTIVPTTVTSYITITNNGAGGVLCQ